MIYTLGELTACIKEQCQQINQLQQDLADLQNPTLQVTYKPVYEYKDIWAEESGGLNANSAEWSFGNGATGYMGLPIDAGWEVIQLGFHADTYPATATVTVDLMSYNTPSLAAANTIASISLANSTDGGGVTNNARKLIDVLEPVPAGVVGFITRGLTGNVSDVRVYARLRREVGSCVEDVTIDGMGAASEPELGEPADGDLVSDNFQDGAGNAPFNLQVRNTTNTATNWQAVVMGPYATIPNLVPGNYTLQTFDNGDGTYTHVFTGTQPLGAFQNIIITGGLPVPAGSGGSANVDLYIP